MKKLSLIALAAAGMLLGACSSDKDEVVENQNVWDGDGDGYMAVSIQLPTTPITRASNDVYNDGLPTEYKVTDAALFLFAGANEGNAVCISAQDLKLPFEKEDDDTSPVEDPIDNLTSSYQITAKMTGNMTASDNLYALVCLNYKNIITITTGNATINGVAVNGKKLSELMASAYEVAGNTDFYVRNGLKNYFFMTNAPQQYTTIDYEKTTPTPTAAEIAAYDATAKAAAPTSGQIRTLALLDKSKIYRTREEAAANPAGDVYVERAVAKATLTYSSSAKIPGTISGTATPLDIESVEWAIDNIEPASYVVRNMGDLAYIAYSSEAFTNPKYRMVGDVKMGKTATLHNYDANIYRTYWCVDPQYSVTATGLLPAAEGWGATGEANPQYCNENTFDVTNQLYKNTTRAILKVTPSTAADFYTINGGLERYTEANAKTYQVQAIIDNTTVINAFKNVTKAGKSFDIKPEYLTVTCADETNASGVRTGKYKVTNIAINETALTSYVGSSDDKPLSAMPSLSSTDVTSIAEAVNNDIVVLKYLNGVVYYEARFQHFANTYFESNFTGTWNATAESAALSAGDLAPWNIWEPTGKKPTSTTAYPAGTSNSADENYLGRYGMVRNNWYDVTVEAFNKIGSPVDPRGQVENPDTPDDSVEDYISVKIHILSWAMRTQQWTL
jgi:hypothetical protein